MKETMKFLQKGEVPTIEMIKADLGYNPPGQGVLHLEMDFAYNAPFYIQYLLNRLEKAEQPLWRRVLAHMSEKVKRLNRLCESFYVGIFGKQGHIE